MNTSKKYIKSIVDFLLRLQETFPNIEAKYAFDNISKYNIVEVNQEVESSIEFAKICNNFIFEFYKEFPNINILICEPDDFNDMTNIVYTISPKTRDLSKLDFMESLYVLQHDSNHISVTFSKSTNNYAIAS